MKGLHRFAMSRREMRAVMAEQDRRIAFLEGDNQALAGRLETRTGELQRALHALEAEKGRVTIAQVGTRDTSRIEDQPTHPEGIRVQPLRDALGDVELKRQPRPQAVFPVQPIPREPISHQFAAGANRVTVRGGPFAPAT